MEQIYPIYQHYQDPWVPNQPMIPATGVMVQQPRNNNQLPRDRGIFHFTDQINYLRTVKGYQWWRPLFTLFLVLGWVGLAQYVSLYLLISLNWDVSVANPDLFRNMTLTMDNPHWIIVLSTFGTTALSFLPPVIFGTILGDGRPINTVTNRFGKMRWKVLFICAIPAYFWTFIFIWGPSLLSGGYHGLPKGIDTINFILDFLVIMTIIPLQCAAEEYLFRGLILQAFGRWIPQRFVLLAPIVPGLFFASMHTQYHLWGKAQIFFMGLIMGYLVLFTGGLEAGIAFHSANNSMITLGYLFGVFTAGGSDESKISVPEQAANLAQDMAMITLFALSVLLLNHFLGWYKQATVAPYTLKVFRKAPQLHLAQTPLPPYPYYPAYQGAPAYSPAYQGYQNYPAYQAYPAYSGYQPQYQPPYQQPPYQQQPYRAQPYQAYQYYQPYQSYQPYQG